MALTPPLIYADLAAARASGGFPFAGVNFDRLAWAIAYAVASWFPAGGVVLNGISVGTAGAGVINTAASKLILAPAPPLVIGGLVSAGMLGPLSVSLGTVVALGFSKSVTTAGQYAGGVVGVGIGADVSKAVSANGPALIQLLLPYMAAMLGPGPASAQMATGLGTGIAAQALTITGTGNVLGSPSIAPASGTSTSVVV
jgi:hypothetical protein